jgi:hypothetical protein
VNNTSPCHNRTAEPLLETSSPAPGGAPPAYTALPVAGIDSSLAAASTHRPDLPFEAATRPTVAPPAASVLPLSARPALAPPAADPWALIDAAAWDDDASTAIGALRGHVDTRCGDLVGQEDLLFGLARECVHESVRVAATEYLGDITSVRAVDLLLTLYWGGDAAVRDAAAFHLSPGTVQYLNHASCRDAPADVDRCLGDLVLFAPADGLVPDDALLVLRSRVDTSRNSVCAALRAIAARSRGDFGALARAALQEADAPL